MPKSSTLSLDIYRRLGFKQVKVLINNRELVKDIPYPAIAAIDKLKKIGKEGEVAEMKNKGISESIARDYLDLMLNLKPDETINIILKSLENYGFDKSWYALNRPSPAFFLFHRTDLGDCYP